jgi:c-di-GMP-binding flagellar brake protein YcgR
MSVARVAGGAVSVMGARLVKISSYGMMIESPVPLEREAVLQFRLVVAGQKADVDARVAACTAVPGSRRYAVGLEFSRIEPETQQRLIRVLSGQEPAA